MENTGTTFLTTDTMEIIAYAAFGSAFFFIMGLMIGSHSRRDLEELQERVITEKESLTDLLENELLEMQEKRMQREKEHLEELRRIERMFTLHRLGKISDEEFKTFLLE